ncbi:hypothetical protein A3K80_09245 [Candidatus Bathyarchaeota archaeon RBG_13_38_9]|nr:MAG: hypothetical protein A3K80_09245 [Candidatus Bathyarchaeota archaeon RBG_13_38_9]
MIAIVNVGKPKNAKRKDERIYEVRVNSKTLFAFTHNRKESLSVCLAKAAEAASQFEQLKEIIGK